MFCLPLDISCGLDPKKRKLIYNGMSRKLIPWAITVFVLLPPLICIQSLFVLAPVVGATNKLPFLSYIVVLGWLILTIFLFVADTAGLLYVEIVVHVINCLVNFHASLQGGKKFAFFGILQIFGSLFNLLFSERKGKRSQKEPWDGLGLFLNFSVYFFAIYPYFFFMFVIAAELDSLIFVYKYWIPSSLLEKLGPWLKLAFHLSRLTQRFPLHQCGRLFAIIFCVK